MISISVVRDKDNFIREFTVEGHAGYAEAGSDIVCSAISAIAYTAAGALEELAGLDCCCERDGYMKCSIPDDVPGERKYAVWVILESAVIGFEQVQYKYNEFVSIHDKEV